MFALRRHVASTPRRFKRQADLNNLHNFIGLQEVQSLDVIKLMKLANDRLLG